MATLTLDFLRGYVHGVRREAEPVAYQYDEGHTLEINIPTEVTSCEIHYWIDNLGLTEAGAYEPTSITAESDGTYTILASVPNTYFETNGDLRVFIVVTDNSASITTYEGYVHICQRQVPDDYVEPDPDNSAVHINTEAQELLTQMQALVEQAVVCTDANSDGNVVITLGGTS